MSKTGIQQPSDTEISVDGVKITVGNRAAASTLVLLAVGGKAGGKIVVSSVSMDVDEARAVVKALQDHIRYCEAVDDI